jgi:hypothetical protein
MPFSVYALLLMLVLVPLVPAFVLFKVLKSHGEVGGPLYGFNIQLGGAFAGYFALFLLVLFAFRPYLIPPPTRLVWKLEGQVVDDHKRPVAITSDNFALLPTPTPPISTNAADGRFIVSFIADPEDGGGVIYPTIVVSYRDYLPKEVTLDPRQHLAKAPKEEALTWDELHHVIYVPTISLSKAELGAGDVHVSTPQLTQGIAPEYQKIGTVPVTAPPPGYANSSTLLPHP